MSELREAKPKQTVAGRRALLVYRHALATRVTHWINVLCVAVLLLSGLQIFNAHPALYWGQAGADPEKAVLEMGADASASEAPTGFVRLGAHRFNTTGFLGISRAADGEMIERGFPAWATLPSWRDLALGRRWHFFFAWIFVANLLAYFAAGLANGHLWRDLLPSFKELRPKALLRDAVDHLKLRFASGERPRRYNPLQKLAYLAVVLVLLPAMVLTGLAMSPGIDAAFPWLPGAFGGRQSARTIHFISASLIVFFIAVHLAMVLLAGPWNELRAMITGRFAISKEAVDEQP